jgi:4-methyl-5(b-hydroxyethyl)-thiazole monophosphate biosynthesis
MAKRVLIPIANGTEELEAIALIDTLRRAGAEVTVASVEAQREVTTAHGVRLVADALIGECANRSYDAIILPGGMPGAEHLRDSAALIALLKRQQQANKLYGAICASPAVVLASHGLLGSRRATGYPGFTTQLPNQEAVASRVVVDGTCVTSRGPGTALEFALALVNILFGDAHAAGVAKDMLAP